MSAEQMVKEIVTEAVRKLQAEIVALESENQGLREHSAALENRLAFMERKNLERLRDSAPSGKRAGE